MANESEILKRRQSGDLQTAARMIGRTTEACRTALSRKEGKVYDEVVVALEAVIKSRESLLKAYNK